MIILSVPQFLPSYLSLATNVFLLGTGLMFCLLAQLQNGCIKNEPNKLLEKYSFLFLGLRKDSLPFSRVNNSTIHAMTGSKSVLTVSRVRNMNETEVQGQAASACLDFRRRHKILSAQVMTFLYWEQLFLRMLKSCRDSLDLSIAGHCENKENIQMRPIQ